MARGKTVLKHLSVVILSLVVLAWGAAPTAEAKPGPKQGNSKNHQGPHVGKGKKTKGPKSGAQDQGPKAPASHQSGKPKHVVGTPSHQSGKPKHVVGTPSHQNKRPGTVHHQGKPRPVKHHYTTRGDRTYVHHAPPPRPRSFHVGPRHRRGYVWVPGHWEFVHYQDQWVWVSGYWTPARNGLAFHAGYWHQTLYGWVWVTHRWM